jgi:hypothetical protein
MHQNSKRFVLLLFCSAVLLFAACAKNPTAPDPAPPTDTPVPPTATLTPVISITPVTTATPVYTATPMGSTTPIITNTPFGTATPVYTATTVVPSSTPTATRTATITSTPGTPTNTPTPAPTAGAFQDFEPGHPNQPYWGAWFANCADQTIIKHGGATSVSMTAHAFATAGGTNHGGTIGVNPMVAAVESVNLSTAATFYIWVYENPNNAAKNNTIELKLRDSTDTVSNSVWSTASGAPGAWTKITWPLSSFSGVDKVHIKNVELYEYNDGNYFFDDAGWE